MEWIYGFTSSFFSDRDKDGGKSRFDSVKNKPKQTWRIQRVPIQIYLYNRVKVINSAISNFYIYILFFFTAINLLSTSLIMSVEEL